MNAPQLICKSLAKNTLSVTGIPAFLSVGTEVNLNVIAMALSGFSDEHNSLWREMCSSHSMELSHPYLRAMFDFLTTESEYYNEVLVRAVLQKQFL